MKMVKYVAVCIPGKSWNEITLKDTQNLTNSRAEYKFIIYIYVLVMYTFLQDVDKLF